MDTPLFFHNYNGFQTRSDWHKACAALVARLAGTILNFSHQRLSKCHSAQTFGKDPAEHDFDPGPCVETDPPLTLQAQPHMKLQIVIVSKRELVSFRTASGKRCGGTPVRSNDAPSSQSGGRHGRSGSPLVTSHPTGPARAAAFAGIGAFKSILIWTLLAFASMFTVEDSVFRIRGKSRRSSKTLRQHLWPPLNRKNGLRQRLAPARSARFQDTPDSA